MIPPFDPAGRLPAGVHAADWPELAARFGSSDRRKRLLAGLEAALSSLQRAGCTLAYVDGSFVTAKREFVTAKREPGDFDACSPRYSSRYFPRCGSLATRGGGLRLGTERSD